jgi:hypothetical protein
MRTDKQREYNRAYYHRTKEVRREHIKNRQREIKHTIQQYKIDTGCQYNDCGYNKCARALSFHHISDDKEHNVAKMVSQGRSLDSIFKEIKKCICVCMNCHLEIHDIDESTYNGAI